MKFRRALIGASDGVIDRVLCVAGAVIFSQIPEFMQQYLQRLGGHLDEAKRQLLQFRHVAEQSGLTLDRLISQTVANHDAAVAKLGGVMTDAVVRVDTLQSAHDALLHASLWTRPFVFARHLDHEIARGVADVFKPAVPTTLEGLVYAAIGMVVMVSIYHFGLRYPVRAVARRRRAQQAALAV
jgi:hypothetical protein